MSMRTVWSDAGQSKSVVAPVSLDRHRVRARDRRAPRAHARACGRRRGADALLLVDLGAGKNRLGGIGLAQVYGAARRRRRPTSTTPPLLAGFFDAIQALIAARAAARLPRSLRRRPVRDAARDGVRGRRRARHRDLPARRRPVRGAVHRRAGRGAAGARATTSTRVRARARPSRPRRCRARASDARSAAIAIIHRSATAARCSSERRSILRAHLVGDHAPHAGAARRCRPAPTRSTRRASTPSDPGLSAMLTFDLDRGRRRAVHRRGGARPRVAILREQGVNGQIEMAAAFDRAGFEAVDVHMTDLLERARRPRELPRPRGLRRLLATATCSAPAKAGRSRILFNARARDAFAAFFARARHASRSACATAAR